MTFPADVPGYEYTAPVDWHEDTVYRIDGPTGTPNHTPDFGSFSGGPIRFIGSQLASGRFVEQLGGPHPPFNDATSCIWLKIRVGRDIDDTWTGFCPAGDDGPGNLGSFHGSTWHASTPLTDVFGAQQATATAILNGFLLLPWEIHDDYDNPWMDDDDLEDEYNIFISDHWPGPDWFLEVEAYHPFFVRFQIAPDEETTSTGLHTENVAWLYDPSVGWNFRGVDEDLNPIWTTGLGPDGTLLGGDYYGGGLADWIDVPDDWQPTQTDDRFDGSLIRPDPDDLTTGIPFTLATDSLYPMGSLPSFNGNGGRVDQMLVVRAEWRTPRLRWYRESTGVIRQYPRDDAQGWGSATRLYPPTKADRIIGGIQ